MSDSRDDYSSATQDEFVRAAHGIGGARFQLDRIFSIREYISNILRHWFLFVLAAIAGTVWGFYYESHAPKLYTVSVMVGPVGDAPVQNSGGMGNLVSVFLSGGSMAAGPPEWSRYVFAMSSVRLAEKLEHEHHLIKKIFASRWDAKTKTWKPTPGFDASVSRFFRAMFGFPTDPPPDIKALQSYVVGNVFLATDKTTGLTTLTMTSGDPKKAMDFLLMVHHTAVQLVRSEISSRNTAKIDYLSKALGKTDNADQRGVLIGMLAQTEQTQMLLNNNLPFAAQIIDTPTVPTQPSSPPLLNIVLMYRIGLLVFLILMIIALDQISGTNFANYTEAKIRDIPSAIAMRVSRYREYGWRGVFSRM